MIIITKNGEKGEEEIKVDYIGKAAEEENIIEAKATEVDLKVIIIKMIIIIK